LIVEDEPLAAGIVSDYIQQVPGLKLKGICENVMTAMEKLRSEKIDLIFLDINLPRINGIEFIKSIRDKYDIVLTTAYHQYAIEGFDLNVTDYLLKPIEFSRFLQAVNKVFERRNLSVPAPAADSRPRKHYFFNVDKKQVKVYVDEILYIESLKDYVSIHTPGKKLITKFQIGEMEKMLEELNFLRIHKSYVVNVDKITAYGAVELERGSVVLPIGRSYKELVERRLGS
jgi:DNA-binding LytR/AlgR family response regulator